MNKNIFRFEQLREDKADVVAFLKRILQQRTDQVSFSSMKWQFILHFYNSYKYGMLNQNAYLCFYLKDKSLDWNLFEFRRSCNNKF